MDLFSYNAVELCRGAAVACVVLTVVVPAARISSDQPTPENRPVSRAITPLKDMLKHLEEKAEEGDEPLLIQCS